MGSPRRKGLSSQNFMTGYQDNDLQLCSEETFTGVPSESALPDIPGQGGNWRISSYRAFTFFQFWKYACKILISSLNS